MKIQQSNELSVDLRVETTVQSKTVETHSKMTDLSDNEKDEIRDILSMANYEILKKLERIPSKVG